MAAEERVRLSLWHVDTRVFRAPVNVRSNNEQACAFDGDSQRKQSLKTKRSVISDKQSKQFAKQVCETRCVACQTVQAES